MPETSLRAYGREIDELIERERLEEAIAHCRYILQTYPKYLETYRLLGKAYLEAKRYGDAADIFQRVLSAVPDDFVSHVGMAIVREDEGNLDAAIWHMERAFETNPSNPAIQQEMKRLISRRDGLEPHKVRLTRGALARMYAHGELFAQAIAELRSALQEDSERPDLQVLLAKMYWQTDQRSDATSVSNQILEKLPYCAEANRILAASLQAGDRVEEAAVYHRRIASLDPYAAFVESALADANTVEESAVQLEKLDWVAGEPLPSAAPGQPGWAATLGMEMQEPSDEVAAPPEPAQTGPLPSWLEPGEPPPFEAAAEKELRDEMETEQISESDLPEPEISEEFEDFELEADSEFDTPSEEQFEPEVIEGDDGRGALGVAAGLAAGVPGGEDPGDLELEDLDTAAAAGLAAGNAEDESAGIEEDLELAEPAFDDGGADAGGMFDREEPPDSESEGVELAETEPQLSPGEDGEPAPESELTEADDGSGESEIPDWMQEAGWTESSGEFEDAPVSFSDQELSTLDAGQLPADQPDEGEAELTPAELPDWIHDIAPDEVEGSSDGAGDEGMPDWIGADATIDEDGEPEEAAFPASDTDTSELPTWISEDAPGATETIVTWLEDKGPDEAEAEVAEGEDLPDWMQDTGPLEDTLEPDLAVPEEAAPELSGESEPVEPEAPATQELSVEGEPVEPEAPATQELPVEGEPVEPEAPATESWLSAVAAVAAEEREEEAQPVADSVEPEADLADEAVSEPPEPEVIPSTEELTSDFEDAMFDEVEITSASTEEVPAEAAGEISDQPGEADAPEWLEEIGTLPPQQVETDSAEWLEGIEVDGAEEPPAETPDWLKGLADEGVEGDESAAGPAPDWLREIGEPGSVEAEAGEIDEEAAVAEEPQEDAGGAPDWLPGVGDEAEGEPVEELGEAEIEQFDEPEPVASIEFPAAAAEEDDEVMDWLEDLAAKQAEAPDEEEDLAAVQVEAAAPVLEERDIPDEPEEGLEWLEHLADQRGMDVDVSMPSQAAPSAAEPEPEPEPEPDATPAWLGRMATQPIPKVDLEALEAAALGEEVSPDAETVEAQSEEVKAGLEQAAPAQEFEAAPPEVAPDDITIEARASDLKAEMEAAEQQAAESFDEEEEIPDWLIAAAEQTEVPFPVPAPPEVEAAPSPEESDEQFKEPEPEAEPVEPVGLEAEPVAAAEPEAEPYAQPMDDAELEAEIAESVEAVEPQAEEEISEAEVAAPEPSVSVAAEIEVPEVEALETVPPATEAAEIEAPEPEPLVEAEAPGPVVVEKPAAPVRKQEDLLELSRQALASGEVSEALEMYSDLIKRKQSLESVIEDLRMATDRTPDNADLWQALGDAYMRDDQTDEAIDAYRKGMEAA